MKGALVALPPPGRPPTPVQPQERTIGLRPQIERMLVFVPVILGLAACGDLGDEPTLGTPDTTVSFSAEVQPIFTAHCALADCHGGAEPQLGLSLVAGVSYAGIVNQPSVQEPELRLIRPSEPESSYLYLKITGAPAIEGMRMPPGSALAQESAQMIRRWIVQGALPDR